VLLNVLNLTNNDLSGEFPDHSKMQQLEVLDLTSNDQLTGFLSLQKEADEDVTDQQAETSGFSSSTIAAISIALALILFLICGIVAYKCYFEDIVKARKRRQRHDEESELQSKSNGHEILPAARTSFVIPIFMMSLMGMKGLRITKQLCKGGFGIVYEG
jgi:hypothetical protein